MMHKVYKAAWGLPAILILSAFTWEGNGSENIPCENGAHWVLAPSKDVTAASVTVDGVTTQMVQSGEGSWSADSLGFPVTEESIVTFDYTGGSEPLPHLQLSHCVDGEVSPSPSPSPSGSPPPTSPPPTSPPPTTPPPTDGGSWTPSWTPSNGEVQPTQGDLPLTGMDARTGAGIAGVLTVMGLTALAVARRKKMS